MLKKIREKNSKFVQQQSRPPYNYTLESLKRMSEDKFIFLQLVISNKWLDCPPTDDPVHNAKLQFIKEWYEERHPPKRISDESFDDFC